jgi:hypothetical protein
VKYQRFLVVRGFSRGGNGLMLLEEVVVMPLWRQASLRIAIEWEAAFHLFRAFLEATVRARHPDI